MKSTRTNITTKLLTLLIILAPLSKYPSWSLPLFNFTSFRIGLYQLLALCFVIAVVFYAYRSGGLYKIPRSYSVGTIVVLALIAVFNLFDSIDVGRSMLMTGSFLFLLTVLCSAWWYVKSSKFELSSIESMVLKSGIVYAILSVGQLVIATFVSHRLTGLCKGCGSDVFGFPRISVFAAEPLFWANALLPFFVMAFVKYTKTKSKLSLYSLVTVSVALALTFARGAFVAVAFTLLFCLVFVLLKRRSMSLIGYVKASFIVSASFMFGFMLLIASATIKYRSSPYIVYNTARGMVEHLTLGKVNLKEKSTQQTQNTVKTSTNESNNSFVSEGLVEASTNERLNDAKLAENALVHSTQTFLFGVGLGNLGPFVVQNINGEAPRNLTVYIFYVLFTVEMGVVGLLCLLFLYILAIKNSFVQMHDHGLTILLILSAFLVHYVFFGSYINVVYIWVWLGIALGVGRASKKGVKS